MVGGGEQRGHPESLTRVDDNNHYWVWRSIPTPVDVMMGGSNRGLTVSEETQGIPTPVGGSKIFLRRVWRNGLVDLGTVEGGKKGVWVRQDASCGHCVPLHRVAVIISVTEVHKSAPELLVLHEKVRDGINFIKTGKGVNEKETIRMWWSTQTWRGGTVWRRGTNGTNSV